MTVLDIAPAKEQRQNKCRQRHWFAPWRLAERTRQILKQDHVQYWQLNQTYPTPPSKHIPNVKPDIFLTFMPFTYAYYG